MIRLATRTIYQEMKEKRKMEGGPVLPWLLVVGVLVHFVVPAYLLTLLIAWLFQGAPTRDLLGEAVRVSSWFLLGYAALTLAAALAARGLDPGLQRRRARREAEDPVLGARRSAERVDTSLARAARLACAGPTGERVIRAVTALRLGNWDHFDERDRKLSADLAAAVDAFAEARGRQADQASIAGLAAASLEQVAAALAERSDERRRLAEGDARTHARYLEARYGPAFDSAGASPD